MNRPQHPVCNTERKPLPANPVALLSLEEMIARIDAIRYEDEPTKRCSGCKLLKSLDEFNFRSGRPAGVRSRCKPCERFAAKRWRSRIALRELRIAS